MAGVICGQCGLSNIPERQTCKSCGASLAGISQRRIGNQVIQSVSGAASHDPLSFEARKAILEDHIRLQAGAGWVVTSRTDTAAQMISEKRPNVVLALLLFVLGIIPGIIYLAVARGTDTIYIEVDEYGQVARTIRA